MKRDEEIEACVEGSQAKILWGAEDVAGRLAAIAADVNINHPPTARMKPRRKRRCWCRARTASPRNRLILRRRAWTPGQVIIQHVEHLHIHTPALEGVPHG